MYYLILTIVISTLIYIIFKLFRDFRINTLQAIVVNYFVCTFMGFFILDSSDIESIFQDIQPALIHAILLGSLFIIVFNFIALTSQKFGVGVASIADKLSLIVPVVFAFILYQDEITIMKLLGILLSIAAVFLVVSKRENTKHEELQNYWYLPLVVFIGAGIISTLLKEVQHRFSTIDYNTFLIFLFGIAAFLGLFFLLFMVKKSKTLLEGKSVIAGIVLGVPNYFTMYYLLKTLDTPNWESSIVFPVMNIGIVLCTTFVGVLFFRERLHTKNMIGLLLAIFGISILLLDRLYV